jgi:hypothetical protein
MEESSMMVPAPVAQVAAASDELGKRGVLSRTDAN